MVSPPNPWPIPYGLDVAKDSIEALSVLMAAAEAGDAAIVGMHPVASTFDGLRDYINQFYINSAMPAGIIQVTERDQVPERDHVKEPDAKPLRRINLRRNNTQE